MNPCLNLSVISEKFKKRITKLHADAKSNPEKIERYCIFAISQLNNFLRAHLLSIRLGAVNSSNIALSYPVTYLSDDQIIDEFIHHGYPRKWKLGRVGTWSPKDEPAFHTPRVFLSIVSNLHPTNESNIQAALADSWKIDVLREVRNYFAHRSMDTEKNAVAKSAQHYTLGAVRATEVLFQYDAAIASTLLDDIHNYLLSFADDIS